MRVLECVSKCIDEAAGSDLGVRSCGATCQVPISATKPAGVAPPPLEVLSTGTGGGIVGSVVRFDAATLARAAASMVPMEVSGVTGEARSYCWSCPSLRVRREARGRSRSAGTGRPASPCPVADEDGR